MHASIKRDLASTASAAGGGLTALAVSIHLETLAPYSLVTAMAVLFYLQWRKRASVLNMAARLFFFCFTFLLTVMVISPWVVAHLGMA